MLSRVARTIVLFVTFAVVPVAMGTLKVGDPAPPFGGRIEWLKGEPVDPTKNAGKNIYVLEFWATWCLPCVTQIPHITELQKKYDKHGVRFVALTSPGGGWQRQRREDIVRFVKDQDDKMGYTVGFDPTDVTDRNYMVAAGVAGIPYALIINRDGKIAWQGHPSAELEHVLDEMIAGRYDMATAIAASEKKKRIEVLTMRLHRAATSGQWEQSLSLLDEILKVDEADPLGIQLSLRIITMELNDRARARAWIEGYLRDHNGSGAGLTLLAMTLLQSPELGDRYPDLALAAAVAACSADARSVNALQAHARALHQIGKIDQAIARQEQAVALAEGPAKEQARRALEFYRTCKQLAER